MRKHNALIYILLSLVLLSSFLLISSSPLLLLQITDGLPLGTLTTWAALISLPLVFLTTASRIGYPASTVSKLIRTTWILSLCLSVLWGFVAFALAGNWAFNFSGAQTLMGVESSKIFWNYTYISVILPLLAGLFYFYFHRTRRQ